MPSASQLHPPERTPDQRPRRSRFSKVLVTALLFVVAFVIYHEVKMLAAWKRPQDMAAYWSAAKLLDQNPYSAPLVAGLEVGIHAHDRHGGPLLMRNPPWALPFVVPLRWMTFSDAYAFWTLLSAGMVLLSGVCLWRLYGGGRGSQPVLLCLFFSPCVLLFNLGQTSAFVLLGATLFLYAVERRQDWLAGSVLLLVSVKPHVAVLFLLAVALWSAYSRRWRILLAAAVTLTAASLVAILLDPQVFGHYARLAREVSTEPFAYPNLGGALLLATRQRWVALVPEIAGLLWTIGYWWRLRRRWDWSTDGPLVLLVSVACSYYSFGFDEILALPALLRAAALGNRKIFWTGFAALSALHIASWFQNLNHPFPTTFLYLSGTAWLALYLVSMQVGAQQAPRLVEDEPAFC